MPCDATMSPGEPAAILSLRALSSSGGSQPISSSAPPSIRTSARLSVTMWLGLASTKCGSSDGLASAVTVTSPPPISRARAARSGVVATTVSFLTADGGPLAPATQLTATSFAITVRFIEVRPLEFVSGMRAEDELELQPQRMVVAEALPAVVVVLQSYLGEFARIPAEVGRHSAAIRAKL